MSQLFTQAAITFQPTDLRIHEQAGEQWLVAPLVAVRAMQLNGEHLTADELEASVEAWAQAIVTLGHPHLDGQNVSVQQAPWFAAGFFAGPTFSANKLRGEAWLPLGVRPDIERLTAGMQAGESFRISTGYFANIAT